MVVVSQEPVEVDQFATVVPADAEVVLSYKIHYASQ